MLGKLINNPCEDSLTAAVFMHLMHLPAEVFWDIIRNACYTDALPKRSGEPTSRAEFWPSWDPKGTRNKTRVEPDLFLRFDDFDLIIEAKRWDNGMQDMEQWRREIIAYANEYGEENRNVRLIALGGLHDIKDTSIRYNLPLKESHADNDLDEKVYERECPIHMCRWRTVLDQCKLMRNELNDLKYPNSQTLATVRILNDLIDLFEHHGIVTGRWFADFSFGLHQLTGNLERHLTLFQNRTKELRTP